MKRLNSGRYALSGGVALAMLAGCGAPSQMVVPVAMPQTAAPAAHRGGSYLYVDDFGNHSVELITNGAPASSLEGQLGASGWIKVRSVVADFGNQPASNWVDRRGNLYVPDYNISRRVGGLEKFDAGR